VPTFCLEHAGRTSTHVIAILHSQENLLHPICQAAILSLCDPEAFEHGDFGKVQD
jgi:hypothetical protein